MKALGPTLTVALLAGIAACSTASSPGPDEHASSASAPIIGGELDTTTKGVVALAIRFKDNVSVFCSGSLIAPNLVLTARHCIARIDDGSTEEVHCDSSKFTAVQDPRGVFISTDAQPAVGSTLYPVREIRQAPGSADVCGYDIALLILSGAGIPSNVASLIEPVLDTPTVAKKQFSAVGFGLQDPNDKQSAGTRMRFDSSSVYCVGASCPAAADASDDEWVGNSPVCSGDSGGPALDAQGRVFGVTSRGDTNCTYALYSNVADWADFVRNTAKDAAKSGGYEPLPWADAGGTVNPGSGGATSSAGASSGGATSTAGASPGDSAGATAQGGASGGNTSSAPTVDPLGETCNGPGECPGTYQCWSANQMPPGECVPPCGANDACPMGYSCDQAANVCAPKPDVVHRASASCAVGSQPASPTNGALATVLLGGIAWLGRRRRIRA